MNTSVARVSEVRQKVKIIPSLAAVEAIAETSKDGANERWLELLTDQGHGATCVLVSLDERGKSITIIDAPRICELLQLG
jgi:hypothetical protein